MNGKIHAGILVNKVRRVIEGLTDDEQGGFRSGRGCVDQIFTQKQIGEKARGKNIECTWSLCTWRRRLEGSIAKHYNKN